MCGVAGFIDFQRATEEREPALRAMLDPIFHRGPDDCGVLIDGVVGLGHRRLAVIDLSAHGHQPMQSNSGRYAIAFNGEIYNYRRLRSELEAVGNKFVGNSDTEVLLGLIEQFGLEAALQKCIGMFALAAWDRRLRVLQLARDRFGEKPLYYGIHRGVLLFGSELKALTAHKAFERRVDRSSVHEFLTFGYTAAPSSIYERTHKVPPGSILTARLRNEGTAVSCDQGCILELKHYWNHQDTLLQGVQHPFSGTFEEATDGVESLLSDAVDMQTQADVPLGAFLSGGVDSSTVVALMQRASRHPIQTFSIGFDEPGFNESHHAKAVADYIGTRHCELYVSSADALCVIPKLPVIYDEPLADSSQIPTYLVAQLARKEVTVSLSGDGADEIFGGYPRYAFGQSIAKIGGRQIFGRMIRHILRNNLDAAIRAMVPPLRASLAKNRVRTLSRLLSAQSFAEIARAVSEICRDAESLMRKPGDRESAYRFSGASVLQHSYLQLAMLLDREGYLPDDILQKVDRATMAVSLESRSPFLDHRIAEFAAALPTEYVLKKGESKRVLKAVLHRLVPSALVDRPKSGFSIPMASWLRGELREWGWDLLAGNKLAEILDISACKAMFQAHLSGERDTSSACWAVFSLVAWADEWI